MRKSILFSAILLLSVCCKKQESQPALNATVQGVVTDVRNDSIIPFADIELWETDAPQSSRIEDFDRVIATSKADSKGNFEIKFNGQATHLYCLRARKTNYYVRSEGTIFRNQGGGQISKINTGTYSYSTIGIRIVNQTPINDEDSILIDDFTKNYFFLGLGSVDTTIYIKTAPPAENSIIRITTKNENGTQISGVFGENCPPLDTCIYTLNF